MGLSSKIINIIRQIYENAYLTLEMNGNISKSIRINRGVLNGDSLSPRLFSLFVSDFDRFLSEAGLEGVSIDANNSISALIFAEDLILLADNPIKLQMMLNRLKIYSENNQLEVNINKTRVMIFREAGRPPDYLSIL